MCFILLLLLTTLQTPDSNTSDRNRPRGLQGPMSDLGERVILEDCPGSVSSIQYTSFKDHLGFIRWGGICSFQGHDENSELFHLYLQDAVEEFPMLDVSSWSAQNLRWVIKHQARWPELQSLSFSRRSWKVTSLCPKAMALRMRRCQLGREEVDGSQPGVGAGA